MALRDLNYSSEVFHNPHIMLCLQWGEDISSFENFKVIDEISNSKSGRPLIIISTWFVGESASFLKPHEYKGVMIQAVVVPGEDNIDKADIIKDIAACTGASVIGTYIEKPPKSVGLDSCGGANLVKINQDWDGNNSYNLIYNGNGTSSGIKNRIFEIASMFPSYDKELFSKDDNEYYDIMEERINSFSETERNYKFKCARANRIVGNEPSG